MSKFVLSAAIATCLAVAGGIWLQLERASLDEAQEVSPVVTSQEEAEIEGLAEVGGRSISEAFFRVRWEKGSVRRDTQEKRREVMASLVDRMAIAEKARALGLEDDPVVQEAVMNVLVGRIREIELQPRLEAIEVTEADVQAVYDGNPERFATPERTQVAVLWFNTRGRPELEKRYRGRLEEARQLLLDGKGPARADGFGALSVSRTEHLASRYKGGVVSPLYVEREQQPWRTAVADVAKTLNSEEPLSEIVANEQGLFLVRWMAHVPASRRPFEIVRSTIERELKRARIEAAEAAFVSSCREAVPVRIDDAKLAAVSLGDEIQSEVERETALVAGGRK